MSSALSVIVSAEMLIAPEPAQRGAFTVIMLIPTLIVMAPSAVDVFSMPATTSGLNNVSMVRFPPTFCVPTLPSVITRLTSPPPSVMV